MNNFFKNYGKWILAGAVVYFGYTWLVKKENPISHIQAKLGFGKKQYNTGVLMMRPATSNYAEDFDIREE